MKPSRRVLLVSVLLLAPACQGSSKSVDKSGPVDSASAKDSAAQDASAGAPDATTRTLPDASSGAGDAGDGASTAQRPPAGVKQATVFFFGHSLVDQDMPLMLGSLAAARAKTYRAQGQLGWGTALDTHWGWNGSWEGAPLGFVDENRGRALFAGEGKAQLAQGTYDVMVMTESNGHTGGNGDASVDYATRLVRHARRYNASIRVFLYSSWLDRSELENLAAWQTRTEADVAWWESVADRVNAAIDGPDIHVLPGAAILSKVTRAVEQGQLPGLKVDDLFRPDDGVHVNDLGFYVIALAHYAAIFRDTPVGLPTDTQTEDGPADKPSAEVAARIQRIVWDYLQGYSRAGIAP